jgi:hypothetical protein
VRDAVAVAVTGEKEFDATCIVKRDGTVWCWGNERGALFGRGEAAWSGTPVKVALPEPPLL